MLKIRKKRKNRKNRQSNARPSFGLGYKGLALAICGGDANLARLWFGI